MKSLILISLMAIGAAQAAPISVVPRCEIEFQKLNQNYAWQKPQNQLTIQMDGACAPKSTWPLKITNATVTVRSQGKIIGQVFSPNGDFVPSLNRIQLYQVASIGPKNFTQSQVITIDTRTGELRSHDGFYMDLSESLKNKRRFAVRR